MLEALAVAEQFPETPEALELVHRGRIEQPVREDVVRGRGVPADGPLGVVPRDGGAAQALEDADLQFVGLEADHPVEVGGKVFQRLARQPRDQVGVDQRLGFRAQETQRVLRGGGGLLPADARVERLVERLHADLQPQQAGWGAAQQLAPRRRQALRRDLQMHLQSCFCSGDLWSPLVVTDRRSLLRWRFALRLRVKELQYFAPEFGIKIEGAVHEFDAARASREQVGERSL